MQEMPPENLTIEGEDRMDVTVKVVVAEKVLETEVYSRKQIQKIRERAVVCQIHPKVH